MSEEQEEKWYNAFTKEQLIERCKYLQRSCERKEDTITDREMENVDLETKIEKLKEENYELYLQCKQYEDKEEDLENKIERRETTIKEVREKIESTQMLGLGSGKTFIATLMNDILEILDKGKE